MNQNMKTETWCGHEIRFVEKDGDWWAVLKDVCDALDLKAYNIAYQLREYQERRNKKDNETTQKGDIGSANTSSYLSKVKLKDANNHTQEMSIVSEKGIYRTIFQSRKEEAEDFQDWVCDVLVELRRASGLESWEAFQMADRAHQNGEMGRLKRGTNPDKKWAYVNANKTANKAIALLYDLPEIIGKDQMTPEMRVDRQPILEATVDLAIMKKTYGLEFKVEEKILARFVKGE